MAQASFVQTSFLGGEWSQEAQGALTEPAYKTAMARSHNQISVEAGTSKRRPGFQHVGTTRSGDEGRLIPFSFKENAPYNMEFTDGHLRFWNGENLVMTNDTKTVSAINTDNPMVAQCSAVHGWSTGDHVLFQGLGAYKTVLHNRVCVITVLDTTRFSLADAITGTGIDGTSTGSFSAATVTRVLDITTAYTAGSWATLRSVQAETRTVLMNGTVQPNILTVATPPLPGSFATFDYDPFNFIDGPYLDPIPGSYMTPSALNGVVTMTLSTQAYDSARAYNLGDLVTSSGVTYISIQGNNQGHTPASSATYWTATNAGAAVGPSGFQSSDVGRLVRVLSEPPLYVAASTYIATDKVSYPSSVDGVNLYYTATASIAANTPPGTSTSWALTPAIATWTWGRVTAVSGAGLIASVSPMGDMTSGGGVAAAFNGNNGQLLAASAYKTTAIAAAQQFLAGSVIYAISSTVYYNGNIYYVSANYAGFNSGTSYGFGTIVQYNGNYYSCRVGSSTGISPDNSSNWQYLGPANPTTTSVWTFQQVAPQPALTSYVGQHYTTAKALYQATVYPSTDLGLANNLGASIVLNLRGKATAPSSSSDGTLLGSVTTTNITTALTIPSNDLTTTWNYVWVELVASYVQPLPLDSGSTSVFTSTRSIAQVLFYQPNVANGTVFSLQIEGNALLYTTAIRTWRLGVFSNTSGWPTCGVYHEGRLWLAGAVGNRIDGSKPGNIFNFAPTAASGLVADDNAIAYPFAAKDVNTIFWMDQDQQGILCGTQAGEWLVQATAANLPLTPTTTQAHRVTKIGCANIEPKHAEHTLLFVQKYGRKIMEYFADVYSGKFSAPNLSEKAKHLTKKNATIAEIAYQQELAPLLWARRTDGNLIGMTYKRDSLLSAQGPTFKAWHSHTLGSTRLVESLCVGPSADGTLDTLAMVTNDPVTNIRHVELMRPLFEETDTLTDAWFLDNAIEPYNYSTAIVMGGNSGVTFTGLWHLEGESVTVFAGGLDLGEYTVSSGAASVPFNTSNALFTTAFVSAFAGVMPVVIGFTYTSQGQLLRPETLPEAGSRNGPGFGKKRRVHKFACALVNTQEISFGTRFTALYPATLKTPGKTVELAPNVLFSGVHRDTMNDDQTIDGGQLCWQQDGPFPGTITGLGGFLETTDE